jgi:glycosyltransferase involved in cell wall biosynthesis
MNVFFIGSFYPEIREDQIRVDSKISLDYAANNFQWALIAGLAHYNTNIKLITQPNIGSFPTKYKKVYFEQSTFVFDDKDDNYCLSFVNIPVFKLLSKQHSLFSLLKRKINPVEDTTIIVYGLHSPFLKAALDLKKMNNKVKVCLIVPDLPEFMSENKNFFYLGLKRIDKFFLDKYVAKVDSFVLLNELMANELQVGNRKWILIEGIYKPDENSAIIHEKEKNKTILYTGNIDERYGIKTLVDAFKLIKDPNYRLWIRGGGSAYNYIKQAAVDDARIIYFEQMSKDKLVELQKKATILVNPISSSQQFTKYFFPSKTMDYLASGTPTLMTRIQGVPNEYYNYVYVAENDEVAGLQKSIITVCSKEEEELKNFGEKAATFILENKNHIVQAKKLFEMLQEF